MSGLPLPIRLALRELRGGLAGFRVFIACLALGVAAIAAVGSVRAAIEQGLAREAASLLGGDAEVEFTYRFADPDERAWMDANATAVSEIVDFRSMAAPAGGDPTLVQVKAVDGGYPLYGSVALAGGGGLDEALAARDGLPGLVAERTLIDRLGLLPGAVIRLGDAGLPARRHARRRARPGRRRLRSRPAGDRAARRPRGERPPGRGIALRLLLPPAPARRAATCRRSRPRPRRASATRGCSGGTAATARPASAASSIVWAPS